MRIVCTKGETIPAEDPVLNLGGRLAIEKAWRKTISVQVLTVCYVEGIWNQGLIQISDDRSIESTSLM